MLTQKMRRDAESDWEDRDRYDFLKIVRPNLWLYIFRAAQAKRLETALSRLLLGAVERQRLTWIHYLLSPELDRFLLDTAPRILKQLTQHANPLLEVGYRVRGPILWSKTIQARLQTATVDSPLFAVAKRERDFNTLENQLFLTLLANVVNCAFALLGDSSEEKYWLQTIRERFRRAKSLQARAVYHLGGVDNIEWPNLSHVKAAKAARNRAYGAAAEHYLYYKELVQEQDVTALNKVLQSQYLEPLEPEDLFELFILFGVALCLEGNGFEINEQHLIGGSRGFPVFCYERGQTVIGIYYQRAPRAVLAVSRYRDLLDHYSLRGQRRPDVIVFIENQKNHQGKYLIIEAKYSRRKSYIVDGVYKLLGYLSDFQEALNLPRPPTGILAAMGAVNPVVPATVLLNDDVILADKDSLRDCVSRLVEHHVAKLESA